MGQHRHWEGRCRKWTGKMSKTRSLVKKKEEDGERITGFAPQGGNWLNCKGKESARRPALELQQCKELIKLEEKESQMEGGVKDTPFSYTDKRVLSGSHWLNNKHQHLERPRLEPGFILDVYDVWVIWLSKSPGERNYYQPALTSLKYLCGLQYRPTFTHLVFQGDKGTELGT